MSKQKQPPAESQAAGEHIFHASELTPLAIQWKQLCEEGRHKEAMLVLEKIIIGSTAMFERLAQFEDFHYTVDLPILVSAAQEKVIKWLAAWKPSKGRLFSWFCLHRDTPILLEDGSLRCIHKLVDERYNGKVLCWNEKTSAFESKQVTNWSKAACTAREWRTLAVYDSTGHYQPIIITKDHRVLTQTGWAPVELLNPRDVLLLNTGGTPELVKHKLQAGPAEPYWEITPHYSKDETADSLYFKYDLTVEDNHNFFAGDCKLLVSNSSCAKNAFRSELVKVNQYRRRYHVTGDNLDKFYGAEDHEVDKHSAAEDTRTRLNEMTARWGDPQEIGAIRFHILCIIDDEHDKQAAIRSAAYAYGISHEMSKFFYNWAVVNLRSAFFDKVYIPFTEHDLLMAGESYTFWPDLVDIVGLEKSRKLCAILGGQRLKVPSLQHIAKQVESYKLARDIQNSDQHPDAVAAVARKYKKTPRSAQEIFNEMVEQTDPKRSGEHSIFDENNPT